MMQRICRIILSIGMICALLGAPTVAQAATTTHATTQTELVSYKSLHDGVIVAAIHRHHHHRLIPKRLRAYRWAVTQEDKPYVWGGTGPDGYDCSGLIWRAYKRLRIRLPRTTFDMLGSSRLVEIPERDVKKGDLAFYGSGHVEFFDKGHVTFGALNAIAGIGWHLWSVYFYPTMFFRIKGAG